MFGRSVNLKLVKDESVPAVDIDKITKSAAILIAVYIGADMVRKIAIYTVSATI